MAVLKTCFALEEEGFDITYLDVDASGSIKVDDLRRAIRQDTILISIMLANNEIGTIQPIKEIGEIAQKNNIFFHTDAVQGIGNMKIDVKTLKVDALSLSAHKFYGPKGVGALFVKKGKMFEPIIRGGHQELNKRAGTENVPGIVGLGKAIEMANSRVEIYNEKLRKLSQHYIKEVFEKIPNIRLNGHTTKRLPGNVNISFDGVDGGTLLLLLASEGICVSSGSACNSGSSTPSHVLTAIGLPSNLSKGAIRVTFGEDNTVRDVDFLVSKLQYFISKIRNDGELVIK